MTTMVQENWVTLDEFKFIELNWMQMNSCKREYELKFDDELLGTLDWKSWYSSKAVGKTADGEWTIKKTGVFQPKVTIRNQGEKKDLAVINYDSYGKATLKFNTGETYNMKYVNMWDGTIGWYDDDKLLIEFKMVMSFDKRVMNVAFFSKDVSRERMSMLMLLGTYHYFLTFNGM